MVNGAIMWIQAHPLPFVVGLCVVAAVVALVSLPQVQDLFRHDHPRC